MISTNSTVRALTRWSDEISNWRLSKLNYFLFLHANVPIWEHKINTGLKFLHKQIKRKGTLFLQLL